jgi:hypothetical protein
MQGDPEEGTHDRCVPIPGVGEKVPRRGRRVGNLCDLDGVLSGDTCRALPPLGSACSLGDSACTSFPPGSEGETATVKGDCFFAGEYVTARTCTGGVCVDGMCLAPTERNPGETCLDRHECREGECYAEQGRTPTCPKTVALGESCDGLRTACALPARCYRGTCELEGLRHAAARCP